MLVPSLVADDSFLASVLAYVIFCFYAEHGSMPLFRNAANAEDEFYTMPRISDIIILVADARWFMDAAVLWR